MAMIMQIPADRVFYLVYFWGKVVADNERLGFDVMVVA